MSDFEKLLRSVENRMHSYREMLLDVLLKDPMRDASLSDNPNWFHLIDHIKSHLMFEERFKEKE